MPFGDDWVTINGAHINLSDPNNPITGAGSWAEYKKRNQRCTGTLCKEINREKTKREKKMEKAMKHPFHLGKTQIKPANHINQSDLVKTGKTLDGLDNLARQMNVQRAIKYEHLLQDTYPMPKLAIEKGFPKNAVIEIKRPSETEEGTIEHIIRSHGESYLKQYVNQLESIITNPSNITVEKDDAKGFTATFNKNNNLIVKAIVVKRHKSDNHFVVTAFLDDK